jgi:hypothetical protein
MTSLKNPCVGSALNITLAYPLTIAMQCMFDQHLHLGKCDYFLYGSLCSLITLVTYKLLGLNL